MNKIYKFLSAFMMVGLLLTSSVTLTSCEDDEDYSTDQFAGGVSLNVFGPCPVSRGGELRFIGNGMNQITSIEIPGCDPITDITVVSNQEIRVIVPQTAEVGIVKLVHAGGTIETKTEITYSEPISIESMAPSPVKPGSTLTITGEYLNLINCVVFSDEVYVNIDPSQKSRHEITVTVPAGAQTGVVGVSDIAINPDGSTLDDAIPNIVYSEEELVVTLPSVASVGTISNAKPEQTVSITGRDLDLVTAVMLPGVVTPVDFTVANNTLSFTLPAGTQDGEVVVMPASEVEVVFANLAMAVPGELTVTPAEELRMGDVITITGANLDVVTGINFPNVNDPVAPLTQSEGEITVEMPNTAQTGEMVLNTASGKSTAVNIATAKPMNLNYASTVNAGEPLTVTGDNLDVVISVVFGGDRVSEDLTYSEGQLIVGVPTTADNGAPVFRMANGESVTGPELTVEKPLCAFITELDAQGYTVGTIVELGLANAEHLTNVTLDGAGVQFICDAANSTLTMKMPDVAGTYTLLLVSDNGEISYDLVVKPSEIVVMGDRHDLGSWTGEADGGAFRIYKADLTAAGFAPGCVLRFYCEAYAFTQIQINDANWGFIDMPEYNAGECPAILDWPVDQERYDRIMNTADGWSDTGLVIQGAGVVITQVTIPQL